MNLGKFSISLTVKNLEASTKFYKNLGFEPYGGDAAQGWLILKNNNCIIGLFKGMFERNMLTFNPGWDQDGKPVSDYTDVRELQKSVRMSGIELLTQADEATSGPASFVINDPDGNPILIDQHV
jgi:catechol 2,3-dioxygenase-like lactoylglutathione lyase family enzyme